MSEYREPPNIDVDKLDFSEWHPLDHQPWQARCSEFYGGWRHHVKIDWELRRRPEIEAWFGRLLCCWWSHHSPQQYWQKREDVWVTGTQCEWCSKETSEEQPT